MALKQRDFMNINSTLLILLLLKNSESWGYKIMADVAKYSDNKINWKEGSLYPVLKSLASNKLIEMRWDTSSARARKYYKILPKGIRELELIIKEREVYNNIVDSMIHDLA